MLRRFFRPATAPVGGAVEPSTPKEIKRMHARRVVLYHARNALAKLSWIFYPIGIVWLLLLPRDEFHHKAAVDENALLPGQTTKYFSSMDMYAVSSYRQRVNQLAGESRNAADCAAFIENELKSFDIDSSTQNFLWATNTGAVSGANAYGVYRAPRGDGTEAIVISAPWTGADGKVNAEGVGYVLAMAKFVTKFSHWSKDFVFLVTQPSPIGTRAWLEAYHGQAPKPDAALQYDPLQTHSGAIQEALNLEFGDEGDYAALEILVDGLNGQLPNADLVTTVVQCAQYESIPVSLHQSVTPESFETAWARYRHKADTLVEYVKSQALGLPKGDHALYARYHIESITLRGMKDISGTQYRVSGEQIGRALESALRSFNNLLERLHHAYWFYIMPTATSYIPMSVYLPPVILLSVTLIFESLAMWWRSGEDTFSRRPEKSTRIMPPGDSDETSPPPPTTAGTTLVARSRHLLTFNARVRPVFIPIVTMVICHATGAFALYFAPTMLFMADYGKINPLNMMTGTLVVTATIYGFMIPTLQRLLEGSGASTATGAPAWQVLKSFACLELGASLIALAMLNPALSAFLAVFAVPPFLMARPCQDRFAAQMVALFVASPVGLVGCVAIAGGGLDVAWATVRQGVEGWEAYGAWLLPFICLVYWPLNLAAHVICGMED
ncbi:Glycosyl phosphatidyl inositol protein transamidase complex subunit [Geranomyces variabilis]|nr:Glycosyl phosphatidyl inositol protein transamidase complex subunit [Geranomyces variabilis]